MGENKNNPSRYLILNADDFGYTQGINKGIIYAHQNGLVTSTTVMMNMPYASEIVAYSKLHPALGIGVHLVITEGKPLGSGYKTLTDDQGNLKEAFVNIPDFDTAEVFQEWSLQIEALIALGIQPTHFDSHRNIHRRKVLEPVVKRLCEKYKLPVRNFFTYKAEGHSVAAGFNGDFFSNNISLQQIVTMVRGMKTNEALEMMCHPAFVDEELIKLSGYSFERSSELQVLCLPELKQFLSNENVSLITYGSIPDGVSYKSYFPVPVKKRIQSKIRKIPLFITDVLKKYAP